jgi:hypothetical protein
MSSLAIFFLAAGKQASAKIPKNNRATGTTPVATWSMAIAMKRKEAPHVIATALVMPHSAGPNLCWVSFPKWALVTDI